MKKLIAVSIGCSLVLAVGALAQQEDAQSTPNKKQRRKARAAQAAQPAPGQPAQQAPAARPHGGKRARERAAAPNNPHAQPDNPHAQVPATGAPDTTGANSNAAMKTRENRNRHQPGEAANTAHAPADMNAKSKSKTVANTGATGQANSPNAGEPKHKAQAKQVDMQKIKTQHANFHAQPKPQQVQAVTFNQNRQITGSEHWQGTQYTVFRSYRPVWHDQNWYHSHYNRVQLFAGGYYFFNAGYWYPAWGYQPSAQYYAYDGPIYAGTTVEPPDRVIADVQAALQEMGYYRGEVDGLLGPLTREALTAYQTDNGLYTTAAIDEPTLNSLGI
jgi:Putative peptidoglycan binding domain